MSKNFLEVRNVNKEKLQEFLTTLDELGEARLLTVAKESHPEYTKEIDDAYKTIKDSAFSVSFTHGPTKRYQSVIRCCFDHGLIQHNSVQRTVILTKKSYELFDYLEE